MLDELKAKLAEIDKKRLYTAVAALIVAGTAGQFMQKSNAVQPNSTGPVVTSSGAGLAPVIAAPKPPETELVTRNDTPAILAPTIVEPVVAETMPAADSPALSDELDPIDVVLEDDLVDPDADMPVATNDVPEPVEITPAIIPKTPQEDEPVELAALDAVEPLPVAEDPLMEETTFTCEIEISATPTANALVELVIDAPCNSGEEIDIIHSSLSFSEQLGTDGQLMVAVPAMESEAVFRVYFEDGGVEQAEAVVADIDDYTRIALIWQGTTGMQLHALAPGASYGDSGHIWAEQPASPNAASGFLSVLGSTSDGYAADVFTYPAGLRASLDAPSISVEAQVLENTCGTKVEGAITRTNAGARPSTERISIFVPGCEAVGEYLVLKNLPQDLKLARN